MSDDLEFSFDDESRCLTVTLNGTVDRTALDAGIAKYPTTLELDVREVPPRFTLPPSAYELVSLEKLTLRGAGKVLEFPQGVDELKITSLDVRGVAASSLPVMPKLETLEFGSSDPEGDVKLLLTRVPNLKTLKITGYEAEKDKALPDELGQWKSLEALNLYHCGLSTLPASIAKLPLKRLSLEFLPMTELPEVVTQLRLLEELEINQCKLTTLPASLSKLRLKKLQLSGKELITFPEVICQVRSLESLVLSASFAKLPESLGSLTVLRELSLAGVLNNGASVYSMGDPSKLKDLPPVIGSLIRLEKLNLYECGVRDGPNLDLAFSKLLRLKKLNLGHTAVTSLAFLSKCVALEELTLDSCRSLKTLEGLEALKRLTTLSLESVKKLKNLDVLRQLPELKTLNIEYLECKDMSALFDLDVELTADDEVLEKYKARAALRGVPTFDALIAQLETRDAAVFEKTLDGLAARSEVASGKKSALLAALTGVALVEEEESDDDEESDEDEEYDDDDDDDEAEALVELPAFEKALAPHLKKVSPLTLAKIFGELYRNVYSNVPLVLTLAKEVAARGDDAAQLKLVEGFERANEFYDAGHRQFEDTVQDVLIDEVLPTLKGAALSTLVTWASDDALTSDLLDAYFVPALERGDATTRAAVMKRLETYFEENESEKLWAALDASTVPEVKALVATLKKSFEAKRAAAARAEALNKELRSKDVAQVISALKRVYALSPQEQKEVSRGVNSALQNRELPINSMLELMRFMQKNDNLRDMREAFFTAAAGHGVDAMRRVPLDFSGPTLSKFLRLTANEAPEHGDVLVPVTAMNLKAWAASIDGTTPEKERSNELRDVLIGMEYSHEKTRHAIALLSRIKTWEPDPVEAEEGERAKKIDWSAFATNVADMTGDQDDGWPALKLLARHLQKLGLEGKTLERVLAQLLGVCSQGKDPEGLSLVMAMVPPTPTWDILAFNVAGVAALAGDRDRAMAMTRLALELGKPPSQFRSDSDFEEMLEDDEFTALLAEFGDAPDSE